MLSMLSPVWFPGGNTSRFWNISSVSKSYSDLNYSRTSSNYPAFIFEKFCVRAWIVVVWNNVLLSLSRLQFFVAEVTHLVSEIGAVSLHLLEL